MHLSHAELTPDWVAQGLDSPPWEPEELVVPDLPEWLQDSPATVDEPDCFCDCACASHAEPEARGPQTPAQARQPLLAQLRRDEQDRSRAFARTMRLRAAMHEQWGTDDGVILELAGTARIGQGRAATELLSGVRLRDNFPQALELLDAGVLRQGTVEILLRETNACTDEVQAEVGRRLLGTLADLDAADARRLIKATVPEVEADLDLAEQERAHAQAKADRGVWVKPVEDGMAVVGMTIDQISAQRFQLDLEEIVRAQGIADAAAGVVRTKAQRRADVLAELPTRYLALARAVMSGKADAMREAARAAAPEGQLPLHEPAPTWDLDPDGVLAQLLRVPVRGPTLVYLHIPMATQLELDHRSGYVEGLGPVPAHLVRQLVPEAGLCRVAVNGRTGVPYGIDPTVHPPVDIKGYGGQGTLHPAGHAELERQRLLGLIGPLTLRQEAEPKHDPSAALRRHVEVRDVACTGPGCSRTARACDLDHGDDYAGGGPTAAWNLTPKSRRCHRAKHRDWAVEHDVDEGTTTWHSPDGSTYVRRSAWQPHPELPDDLVLPPPRIPTRPPVTRSRPEQEDLPPVRQQRQPRRAPKPPDGPRLTWDTGPPPF